LAVSTLKGVEMIFAQFKCVPGRRHPDFEHVGVAYVNCWLRVRSCNQAKVLAERNIRAQHWKIRALEEIRKISRGDYDTKSYGLPYHEQAIIDREVYAFHLSPKFPVYCVDFDAVAMKTNARFPRRTCAFVKYWVTNEKVSPSSDPYDDFWGKLTHKRKAVSLGRRLLQGKKWRVTAVRGGQPVNYRSFPKDPLLTQYYEEAEEHGECIAFWIDHST
jgi:hypothetical protein